MEEEPSTLRIVVEDEQGQPYTGKKYRLKVGTETYDGTTDGNGLLEHDAPLAAEAGELTVWMHGDDAEEATTWKLTFDALEQVQEITWKLDIGHLDPVEETTDVQARLNNLGFDCGAMTNTLDPKTQEALQAFQAHVGFRPTGRIDEATRRKLCEMHDALT